jgi:hypothetical protein
MNGLMIYRWGNDDVPTVVLMKDLPSEYLVRAILMYNMMRNYQEKDVMNILNKEVKADPALQVLIGRGEKSDFHGATIAGMNCVIMEYASRELSFYGYSPDDHAAAYVLADIIRSYFWTVYNQVTPPRETTFSSSLPLQSSSRDASLR